MRLSQDEAARISKVPTDKTIPDGVEDMIVGDGVAQYKQLRELERRLDALITRKRLQALDPDVRQGYTAEARRYRKMRIWISNTVDNQPWQGGDELDEVQFDFDTGIEATYRVKIEGRLLPDQSDDTAVPEKKVESTTSDASGSDPDSDQEDLPKPPPPPPSPHIRMSHAFSQITIDFDRSGSLQPEGMTAIEWKKPARNFRAHLPPTADFDCLEFERKSDENINCTINLYRDEQPERYTLSNELADVVASKEEDRASILVKIWEYVKIMGLQQEEDKRMIRCDDRLKAVSYSSVFDGILTDDCSKCFQKDIIFFPELAHQILPHLSAPAPISLAYTIRVDSGYHASPSPTVYDVLVPSPPDPPEAFFQPSKESLRAIANLDSAIPEVVQALQHSKAKHAFLTSLSRDPVHFMQKWITSQSRDMEIILGDDQQQSEIWKKGGGQGVWASDEVRESVSLLVQRESR